VGTGAFEGKRDGGFSMIVLHGITPETDTSTHYIWSIATHSRIGPVAAGVFDQIAATIAEDKVVLETQQRCIDASPGGKFVDVPGDVGSNQARRLLRALFEAECQRAAG
jgi:vanillate O-demethylase monooxygenase subunit